MTRIDISAWGEQPPLFIQLLAAEAKATDKSKAAARIGMSRTAVSLVLANKYTSPSTAGVERRVMEILGRIECAAVVETITVEQCQSYRSRPAPTHNPNAMHHWRACQQCPMNPNCAGGGNATVH